MTIYDILGLESDMPTPNPEHTQATYVEINVNWEIKFNWRKLYEIY